MKRIRVIAPLALAAAGALVTGIAVLLKKPADEAAQSGPSSAPSQALRSGSYSFISGYRNPVTVELGLDYDADRWSYAVISEEFPSYSSDSHVAVLYGSDFDMQIEYAAFYNGEDFAAHSKSVAERFQGFGPVRFGSLEGIRYIDGDNICLNLPIPGDACSYLLVTLMKRPDNDADFTTLPEHPDTQAILGSFRFQIQ